MNNANKNIYGYSKFIIHGLKCNAFNYFIIKKKKCTHFSYETINLIYHIISSILRDE